MRNARGVFGNAAVICERCNRFSVRESRRAQGQPLGLEDGDTGLAERFAWYFFQQCHGLRLLFFNPISGIECVERVTRVKCEEREPVSPVSPSQDPMSPAGLTG